MHVGFVDIQAKEIQKHMDALAKKRGTCDVLPAARYSFYNGRLLYDGLVCHPMDMGGNATGVSAEWCENCIKKKKR